MDQNRRGPRRNPPNPPTGGCGSIPAPAIGPATGPIGRPSGAIGRPRPGLTGATGRTGPVTNPGPPWKPGGGVTRATGRLIAPPIGAATRLPSGMRPNPAPSFLIVTLFPPRLI